MKSHTAYLTFNTKRKREFINITHEIEAEVKKSSIQEGLCLVNAMHITASVFINDNENGLLSDFEAFLERLAPHEPIDTYKHNLTGEDNGDAHIKRTIMGREVVVAITGG
jgi:secondary thiamine-phosphate synthase enzyme